MKKFIFCILASLAATFSYAQESVVANGFFDNWYAQAALDMTLQCPYGKDFSQVFPKGKTFGVDVGVGKWFSPQIGFRLRFNWENGIKLFRNNHLEWVANGDNGKSNMDNGGFIMATFEVPVSVSNIVMTYDPDRRWNAYVFARMGLISNRATKSGSPLIGGGLGYAHRVHSRLNLYGEFGMQATTSEFYHHVAHTGMQVSMGFNCMFDFEVGLQYTFGTNTWRY